MFVIYLLTSYDDILVSVIFFGYSLAKMGNLQEKVVFVLELTVGFSSGVKREGYCYFESIVGCNRLLPLLILQGGGHQYRRYVHFICRNHAQSFIKQ